MTIAALPTYSNSFGLEKIKYNKAGRKSHCLDCRREYQRNWHKNRRQMEKYKRYDKNYKLKKAYGITLDFYEHMLHNQQYSCAICKVESKSLDKMLAVDHDHSTGRVRGLLCKDCNTALGIFKDNKEALKSAIKYLEEA